MRDIVREMDDISNLGLDLATWLPESIYSRRAFGDCGCSDKVFRDTADLLTSAVKLISAIHYQPTLSDLEHYKGTGEVPEQLKVLDVDNYKWEWHNSHSQFFTQDSIIHEDYKPEWDHLAESYRELFALKIKQLESLENS